MSLDKNDLKAISELMDLKMAKQSEEILGVMDLKMAKQSEEILGVMDLKMAKQSEEILSGIDKKTDDKMLDFHEKVTVPMIDSVIESLKEDISMVDNKIDRIERKLDAVTDMLAVKITDHEKRITRLEVAVI